MCICEKGDTKCHTALRKWRERTGNRYGCPSELVDITTERKGNKVEVDITAWIQQPVIRGECVILRNIGE